jgi:archaellum biogenesis ATPase FlaH
VTMGREQVVKIDPSAEQVVLSAMLVDRETLHRVIKVLPPDRWQVPQHRAAVRALEELDRKGLAYDQAAVRRLFPDVDVLYLEELAMARPTPAQDLQHYVYAVRWDALRADAFRGPVTAFLEAAAKPETEPEAVRRAALAIGEAFGAWRDGARVSNPVDVHERLLVEMEARVQGRAVYPFGIDGLDDYEDSRQPRLIPGAKPGKITIVTGTSGSGKTTLAARMVLGQMRQKRRVLYGAWENTDVESTELLAVMSLADEGRPVSRTQLMTGRAPIPMVEAVKERARDIGKFVRFVPNPFQRKGQKSTNDQNLDIVERLIGDMGADVFVADLWERCLAEDRPEEIQQGLFRQQAICEQTRCHGILLQQQRLKDVEARADRRPTREGIKGTSAWVDIADTILGVYRPAQWKAVPDDLVVVDVLKQRYAPWPLSVEIEWDPDRAWFGRGTSVPYDQPMGRELPSEIDRVLDGGARKSKKNGLGGYDGP